MLSSEGAVAGMKYKVLPYKEAHSLSTKEDQLKCNGSDHEGQLTFVWSLGNSGKTSEKKWLLHLDLEGVTKFEPSKNINYQYSFNTMEFANEHFHYLPSSDPQSIPQG